MTTTEYCFAVPPGGETVIVNGLGPTAKLTGPKGCPEDADCPLIAIDAVDSKGAAVMVAEVVEFPALTV